MTWGTQENSDTPDIEPEDEQDPLKEPVPENETGPERKARKKRDKLRREQAEKRKQALEYRTAGMTYQQIADALGYASAGAVHRVVQRELAAIPREAAKDLLARELNTLDMLQASAAKGARGGDPASIGAILKVQDMRAKLLGMYGMDHDTGTQDAQKTLTGFLAAATESAARILEAARVDAAAAMAVGARPDAEPGEQPAPATA